MLDSDDEEQFTVSHLSYSAMPHISPSKAEYRTAKEKKKLHSKTPTESSDALFYFEDQPPSELETVERGVVLDDLLTVIPDWAVCSVCTEAFKNPRVTPCGHTFCLKCLDRLLSTSRSVCPLCRRVFDRNCTTSDFLPNHQLIQVIDSLPVKCVWGVKRDESKSVWVPDDEGCPEIIEWQNVKIHSSKCPYALVRCPNRGCKLTFRRNSSQHTADCQYRIISCQFCKTTKYKKKNEISHQKICPQFKVSCPNNCGQMVENRNMEKHLQQECSELEVPCLYAKYGCPFRGKVIELDHVHLSSCIFHSLRNFLNHVDITVGQLSLQVEMQQKIIEKQQKKIVSLQKTCRTLEQQQQHLQQLVQNSQVSPPQEHKVVNSQKPFTNMMRTPDCVVYTAPSSSSSYSPSSLSTNSTTKTSIVPISSPIPISKFTKITSEDSEFDTDSDHNSVNDDNSNNNDDGDSGSDRSVNFQKPHSYSPRRIIKNQQHQSNNSTTISSTNSNNNNNIYSPLHYTHQGSSAPSSGGWFSSLYRMIGTSQSPSQPASSRASQPHQFDRQQVSSPQITSV